ncbi:cilia- and flagella-associated protein 54-like [Tubulanus polymorphus]|uniref:cilia- and flagella-associated protein 54-like n=1 Tax=Tubulanus polymorphus TaxID=672921 RepID=UPI003DA5D623
MQRALMLGSDKNVTKEQSALLGDALNMIVKTETSERNLYIENMIDIDKKLDPKSKVPPSPILLSRTDTKMVFKPGPFEPVNQKVAWYRLFGRPSRGSNIKVRLNDYFLPGTGQQIPSFRCELSVSGLQPGEQYVFAVAAYTAEGKLIGESIGETSKPILASHPLPVLMTWAYLSQVGYQVGCNDIAQRACEVLWNHFVGVRPPPDADIYITSKDVDTSLTLYKLNKRVISLASPVLLRQFLTSIFINVDIDVRQGLLFCDTLCDQGPLHNGQMSRLRECERMLVAIELAGWLNEANLALQAIVQCYGLTAPLIQFKIPSLAVIQILQYCLAVLLEIPVALRQRRQASISESLHHMTACMTYHMAKVLRTWGQRQLANHMNDNGRRLLAIESTDSSPQKQSDKPVQANATPAEENAEETAPPEIGALTLAGLKKRKGRNKIFGGKDDADGPNNEELKALEAHILRLSRQAQSEHELIGNEDPSILYAYIAYLPSRIAYKEVVKFKRRARYIEFFVQVAVKALAEGLASSALDWCEETAQWLNKRNDQIIGPKVVINKQPGAVTVGATDDAKKYAVTMVEFNKEKKTLPVHPKREAMEVLTNYLPDIVHSYLRRKKLRKVCVDEMPWRAQLNNLQGLSQFGVFMQKLELMEKMGGNMNSNSYRTSFLDLEWFTLETTGTLIVGWDGGPSRQATKMDLYTDDVPHIIPKKTKGSVGKLSDGPVKMSAVERAAAISTGILPPAAFPVIEEGEETPRTYRSEETVSMPRSRKADPKIDMDAINILTPKSAETMLKKTFNFFQRSIVLAHRGKHWTSLQNACRGLWNCAHNALLRTAQSSQNPTGLLTFQALRLIVLPAFYTAADCLLEMLVTLQNDMEEEAAKPRNRRRSVVVIETWMGGIADEKGGASLKFEKQLDDISIVDTRWVRRIVLRVLELLSFERKWEKLVDLALRFNAVTYDRYATQVCPLLIHAQHKLIDQVNTYGGEEPPQSHYQYVETQINGPVTSRNYQDIQLKASCVLEKLSFSLDPGAQLDPDNYDLYDGAVSAKKNIRVPLDIDGSLNELCTALDKSQYTARALQHSRKLLVLYLAGQQNANQDYDLPREVSKVDFAVPVTAQPQLTMPPDLKVEDFMKMDDVQNAPLPKTQIGVVVASYIKTIELLKAKNQKSVAAQAMHELANLYYHAGNIKGAYQWWSDSLDIIMNITDSLHKWRDLVTGDKNKDISTILQERYGLWGCLLAGVLSSKIAQYVLTSDLGLRMETCFLSGYCFKALFRASLPHPIADRDYALYDIGEGCEVTNLVPGIDLFSDRFRCDGRTVVAALRWVTEELARGRHNLFVLPLLSLNQYFTTFVCRDLQRSVDGRILKVRVLTDLGLFTEAFIILMRLLHGERLPQTVDSNFRQMESKMSHNTFCTSKPVLDPKNLQVLENAIDKRLSSNLGTLYGPHLTCRLSIVQAHLLNAVAQTIPVIPDFTAVVLPSGPTVKGTSVSMDSVGVRFGSKRSKPATVTSQKPKKDDAVIVKGDSDSDDSKEGTEKRFSPRDKKLSMEYVKGTLLGAADKMMTAISEIILESAEMDQGTENIPAAELELVVLAKLELANVARQRHHASMAARCVLAAMKLLQNSEVYREKSEIGRFDTVAARNSSLKGGRTEKTSKVQIKETETTMFQYQNFQSRARLDTRLWLDCRLSLVESLMCELRGMGEIKGPERAVKVELADCRLYCAEGVAEAEAVGDTEMLAEFLMQAALLDIMEGKSIASTEEILQEILKILSGVLWLSPSGQLLRVTAMIQLIDLVAAGKSSSDEPITEKTLLDYLNAQKLLLDQFHLFGEKVEHHNAIGRQIRSQRDGPVSPMQNIYLRHVALLIQVKLRIGHAMARNVTRYSKKHGSADAAERWTEVLGVLSSALELNKISARRTAHLEAVILLNIGKVQRQLCSLGSYKHRAVASTFLEAIKISHAGSHDLGLIRQAYLEIALVYLSNTGMMGRDGSPDPTSGAESETDAGSTSPTLKRRGKRPTRRSKQKPKEESEMDKEKRAAWLSIRCAAAVGQSMRSQSVLTGDVTVSSVLVDANSQSTMPEFAVLDLISSYVLGEKKIVFKNEIEEELSTMPEAQDPKIIESYEEQVQRTRESAADISWVHLLGYQSLLQRICSTATVSLSNNHVGDVQKPASDDNAEQFDLGFVVHSDTEYTPNHDVVRIPLHSDTWAIRLNHMHRYFTENLPVYKATCVAVYPPAGLILPLIDSTATATTELPIFIRKYPDNMLTLELQPDGSFPEQPLPPGLNPEPHKPSDKEITTPSKSDLIVQWYQPVMQELEVFNTELNRAEQKLMMFYSVNKKNPRSSSNLAETVQLSCNMMWISLSQILELHDRLTLLAQRAEISLADPPSKQTKPRPDSVQSVTGQPRTRKGQRIKALSATEKKDDQLEAFLRQCLTDIQTLFGVVLEKSEPEDVASQTALSEEGPPSIPFEMTKSNVCSIEKLFNPNYGFILNNRDMFKWFSMIFTNIS